MKKIPFIYATLASVVIAIAWYYPSTQLCVALGWVATFLFCLFFMRKDAGYLSALYAGTLTHLLGFYWLVGTIKDFGGYSLFPALFIFFLYAITAGIQFVLALFIYKRLPEIFSKLGIAVAISWCTVEFLFIRIFPWYMGHTQIEFTPFAGLAAYGGVSLISFVMFWIVEALIKCVKAERNGLIVLIVVVFSVVLLKINFSQMFRNPYVIPNVAVVQANINMQDKHDQKSFSINVEKYLELTKNISRPENGNVLVIWPESVIMQFVYDNLRNAALDPHLPFLNNGDAMLLGALSSDGFHRYNSAFGIYPDGIMPPPYHKQILMPFGEYMPFMETFPWLAKMNPMAANGFTAGDDVTVFEYPMHGERGTVNSTHMQRDYILKVSPLICYEDLLPELSRRSVKAGAEVLIAASRKNLIKNKDCCFVSLSGRLTFGKPEKRVTKEQLEQCEKEGSVIWEGYGRKWKVTQQSIDERKYMNPKNDVKNIEEYRRKRILHVHGTLDTSTPTEEASVIEKEIPGVEVKWIMDANHSFVGKEDLRVKVGVDWLIEKLKK